MSLDCNGDIIAPFQWTSLSTTCIPRKYFLIWKQETITRSLYRDEHHQLTIAIQYNSSRLTKFNFLNWFWFSRTRGKRIRLAISVLKRWKNAVDVIQYEAKLLKRTKATLQYNRVHRCLHSWMNAMHTSIVLHGYQLHRILNYAKHAPYLCLPPTLVEQNPRLLMIHYWKLVRG